jgi:hypothetical protein
MKARVRVDRVHAATAASLPDWRERLEEAMEEAETKIKSRIAELMTKRTLCGGPKYNEVTARKYLESNGDIGPCSVWYYRRDCGVFTYQDVIAQLEKLEKYTKGKKGFMILLEQSEYNKIFNHL